MSVTETQTTSVDAQAKKAHRIRRKQKSRTAKTEQNTAPKSTTILTEEQLAGKSKQARKRARRYAPSLARQAHKKALRAEKRTAENGEGETESDNEDADNIVVKTPRGSSKNDAQRADAKEHSEVAEASLDSPSQQLLGE